MVFSISSKHKKICALGTVAEAIKTKHIGRVLSFGCGPGVLEYILKMMFGEKIEITATDYDAFLVKKGNEIFSSIQFVQFDFYHDSVSKIVANVKPDLIVMFGSACSMDDKTYEHFLSELYVNDIKYVCSFEAGVTSILSGFKLYTQIMLRSIYRYLCKEGNIEKNSCHAFSRSKANLKRIYRSCGYSVHLFQCEPYKCAVWLEKG